MGGVGGGAGVLGEAREVSVVKIRVITECGATDSNCSSFLGTLVTSTPHSSPVFTTGACLLLFAPERPALPYRLPFCRLFRATSGLDFPPTHPVGRRQAEVLGTFLSRACWSSAFRRGS